MSNYDFLVEATSTPTDECIVWPYGKSSNGYGRVKVDGKMCLTHRVALQLTKPRPTGKVCSIRGDWVNGDRLQAAHGPCHNPACFNPQHLSWKTHAENMGDKERDGTDVAPSNEDHGRCRVSDADIARIRELYRGPQRGKRPKTGPTLQELADQFSCGPTQVHRIVNNLSRTG